ncbi:MAG: glycosyltransferase family A protein [Pseudomonadota bacterium]
MELLVSILIPTLNREEVLCETIGYCLDQSYPNYEVIVVDQTDNHNVETKKQLEVFSNKIKYFNVPCQGLPQARNVCIDKAEGDILIFIDDDVILNSDFVQKHVQVYEREGDIDAIAGGILEEPNMEKADIPITKRNFLGRPNINYHSSKNGNVLAAKGCNMSFRRKVFDLVGGFDEALPAPYLREDTDFFYRMNQMGLKTFFSSEAYLIHLKTPSGGTSELKMSTNKTIATRAPWNRRASYLCETVFQLKHYSLLYFPLYLTYFFIGWVVLKNIKQPIMFLTSAKEMCYGVVEGCKYFYNKY